MWTNWPLRVFAIALIMSWGSDVFGQSILSGRLNHPRFAGSTETIPLSAIYTFGSLPGSDHEAIAFRTWETQPAAWYRLAGSSGNYTLLFSTPGHFMRPVVRFNLFSFPNETIDRNVSPTFDYAVFDESAWDGKNATDYFQPFVAKGKSLTSVGFRLAHDGVDGFGPGKQDLVASIHRKADGTPDMWPQVGPGVSVIDVDSGGGKNYTWAASWNSGEVPLVAGEIYAVHLRAKKEGNTFQAFWHKTDNENSRCYRLGEGDVGYSPNQLWMAVGTDSDGLLIPYNKRVQRQFTSLTRFGKVWHQTYIAQGTSVAGVILYAACSGVQPSMNKQRVAVRFRRDSPTGDRVGIEKIAIGNANYTGDASWGVFGVAFAPGEVPLEPGKKYCIEWESIENHQTLHGFVNIKGQKSDDKPGFNPYRKHVEDVYEPGTAYFEGKEMGYDLDMQVIEYERPTSDHAFAVLPENLLKNGDMQRGLALADNLRAGLPDDWERFHLDAAGGGSWLGPDSRTPANQVVNISTDNTHRKTCDTGLVQRISGLERADTYRLSVNLYCSHAVDDKHACMIGLDPTGQTDNPKAETIHWMLAPGIRGRWATQTTDPVRPAKDSISVWLRARSTSNSDGLFTAEFDDAALRKVRTTPLLSDETAK